LTPHSSLLTPHGFFVTGTDTGVGKTLVACALLHAFARTGMSCVGMKPVAAGCEMRVDGLRCEDVEALKSAASVSAPIEWINPYALISPIAPHIAARQAGIEIELARIENAYEKLRALAKVVIVEGVGGFKVPLNESEDVADLACRLNLPVILVVGMRLGCLNHALLTAEAIRACGLKLAGWVANQIDPEMNVFADNLAALKRRIRGPRLGTLPYHANPQPDEFASRLMLPETS
jgi:dethiobiotin synthetase